MKFVYEYRTSDNIPHRDVTVAPTKEAAYESLKARGIKPAKVWEAPGFFNKAFGKGKRWIAICVLTTALVVLCFCIRPVATKAAKESQDRVLRQIEDASLYEDRGQIYGPAVVMSELESSNFGSVFKTDVDRFLAAYAIPGRKVTSVAVCIPQDVSVEDLEIPVPVLDDDYAEVKQLKRIVNGMRRELAEYLVAGGSVSGYVQRLEIRQKAESAILERAKIAVVREQDLESLKRTNVDLRAKGLPMLDSEGKEN